MSTGTENQFRTIKTRSLHRAFWFLIESIALLTGYIFLLCNNHQLGQGTTHQLLIACGVVYLLRLNLMAHWLLPREIAFEELTFVMLVWLPSILASIAMLARSQEEASSGISMAAYSVGSFVNTFSELQRKAWKARPDSKGRCFTKGLFSLSRNVNYAGDTLLFAGWAGLTGSWWNAWIPVAMALSFYYYHIPTKERYLAARYKSDWPKYVASTKSFIPFLC